MFVVCLEFGGVHSGPPQTLLLQRTPPMFPEGCFIHAGVGVSAASRAGQYCFLFPGGRHQALYEVGPEVLMGLEDTPELL